ncbi:MAG TPA: S53 family peptidase, partial [Candidatus Dormibacteraeota bacterium]
EDFAATHGADPSDLATVETFAGEHGLSVVRADAAQRTVVVAGSAAAMTTAFGVTLARYRAGDAGFRGRSGTVSLPASVAAVVEAVMGLDDRPQVVPQFRVRPALQAAALQSSFDAPQVATLYSFPTGVDGTGQTIAILELGGGYHAADLDAYFSRLGLKTPQVTPVSVDHGRNQPGNPADGEVELDIEVAGSVAPGAHLAVYFAPNTDRGFLDALSTAVHDAVRKPSVVSISWGGPENAWSQQAMAALDAALQDAAALGVTVCCASGDDGSSDRVSDGLAHCDFPASSPHALACGGTKLEATGGKLVSETVWNEPADGASGGGVSDVFALPSYQAGAGVPPSANPGSRVGRGVPDVAGDADPQTGYNVTVDGQQTVIGGTSAVAPLWAGLIALCNQALGRSAGYIHPMLYAPTASRGFTDITSGSNGAYSARAGWDACTGLGTPVGTSILATLRAGLARGAGASSSAGRTPGR